MNPMQWKRRRAFCILLGLIFVYLLIRIRRYEERVSVFLPDVHPNEPWEFVADFSNMKYLNPTIIDFTVTDETGNYDHWKYTVEYTENLSHWPYLFNFATAHFQVRSNEKKDAFFIQSVHKTCMLMEFYCVNSESEFKFYKNNFTPGTKCEESVVYECPAFLSWFCQREVLYQRNPPPAALPAAVKIL